MSYNKRYVPFSLAGALVAASLPVHAIEAVDLGESVVNVDGQAILGTFHSDKSYISGTAMADEYRDWEEGAAGVGIELMPKKAGIYARASGLGTATWGDGDAAGYSSGEEREFDVEDAYLGYRNPAFGNADSPWSVDLSAGRQKVVLGDGFLIGGDVISLGDTLGEDFDRGGAVYLARRQAFDKTAVASVGKGGWNAQATWFESDNAVQASTEMAAFTLSHSHDSGVIEGTYLRGLGVDEGQVFAPYLAQRDGMDVYSLRFEQKWLDDKFELRGEFARQEKDTDEDAWYLQPSWSFSNLPAQPTVSLRYSRFSEQWDPLFFGLDGGYGTWFQGEVAGNYAGPFNNNAEIWQLGIKSQVSKTLSAGLLAYDFSSIETSTQVNTSAKEVDLYMEWMAKEWLYISPMIGVYDPDESVFTGGTQLGDDDSSVYAQLIVGVFF